MRGSIFWFRPSIRVFWDRALAGKKSWKLFEIFFEKNRFFWKIGSFFLKNLIFLENLMFFWKIGIFLNFWTFRRWAIFHAHTTCLVDTVYLRWNGKENIGNGFCTDFDKSGSRNINFQKRILPKIFRKMDFEIDRKNAAKNRSSKADLKPENRNFEIH